MNNLNKYTKADLISKIKKLDNEKPNSKSSLFQRILDIILQFKSLLLKLTLITFLIKWIKKYSLIKKIWHIISSIASMLLGISFIDIYGFDLISFIRQTQIYKWFSELLNTHNENQSHPSIPSFMRTSNQDTTRSEENKIESSRISEWYNRINKQEIENNNDEIIENTPFYYNKYFIIGALTITVLVSWYYLDEIKTGYGSIIDWLNSFRRGPSGDTSGSNTNSSTTPTTKNIQSELDKLFPEKPHKDIELIDKKGKSVLTSPSLEDLNQKAEDSWSESSASSSSTVTPANFIDQFEKKSWRLMLVKEDISKISFVEKTFISENDLDISSANKLVDYLADIMCSYEKELEVYKNLSSSLDDKIKMKQGLFHFRKWIHEYHEKILPLGKNIHIGNINDEPLSILK